MRTAAFRFLPWMSMVLIAAPLVAAGRPDLDWLAGAWCTDDGKLTSEEHWLSQRGGLMLGMSRTITKRGTEFEFIRIELDSKGARYIAQPSGGPATVFELVEAKERSVLFANPQHDFPKRIRYTRHANTLTARIDGGDDRSAREFVWKRCQPDKTS